MFASSKVLFSTLMVLAASTEFGVNAGPIRTSSKLEARDACQFGEWQCNGEVLQRCHNDQWNDVQTCSTGTHCSAGSAAVGCIWGSADPSSSSSSSAAPTSTIAAAPTSAAATSAATNSAATSSAATNSASSPASSSSSSAAPAATSAGNTPVSTSGMKQVIYADNHLADLPSPSELAPYNHFILAFWLQSGPADNGLVWQNFGDAKQKQIKAEYNAAGINLMVSAFGATDMPTSSDPVSTAQSLAAFVKANNLDGVDIDYEDNSAFTAGTAEPWLISFQTELRRQLPNAIISHAPQAPYFTSSSMYPSGGYSKIHSAVGSGIDFYNVQFYNQGAGAYTDCNGLLHSSGTNFPDTSVFQINSVGGVPLEKIVIGKPLDTTSASNGYMDAGSLATCVSEAQGSGWNGGVMYWQWDNTAASVMKTVMG